MDGARSDATMQTLISVFEDSASARRAKDLLLAAGFDPANVHLQPGAAAANTPNVLGSFTPADAEPDRGVLSSIGHFFASLFEQDPPTGGYADRFAQAVRRGHPAIMVDAQDDEEVDRASTILHENGAFDIDERIGEWRDRAGTNVGTGSRTGVEMGTGPAMQTHADRRGVHVLDRLAGRPILDLVTEHELAPADDRPVMNRPASTEGENRVIERGERERAMASEPRREPSARENDLEAREPKG
jgi:hypothetical protein